MPPRRSSSRDASSPGTYWRRPSRTSSSATASSPSRAPTALPSGMPTTLDEIGLSTANKNTFPNGCHVCELEIDETTGATEICNYSVVDDFGVVVNPMIVEGQIQGGIAQGIGQALMEHAIFDAESGQLVTGSLMDYAVPRAEDIPNFSITFNN